MQITLDNHLSNLSVSCHTLTEHCTKHIFLIKASVTNFQSKKFGMRSQSQDIFR